jgi:hypothetical protein
MFAFGCLPHAIHNLCMDVVKTFPRPKQIVKQIVMMVKGIRSVHLITALYDKLCLEKYGKVLVLILFTRSRWATVFFAAQRANRVKAACAALPGEITHAELDIDMPEDLRELLIDPAFWRGVSAMERFFKPICCCLTYLEGDGATFSSVYACFLAMLFHVKTLSTSVMGPFDLDESSSSKLERLIIARFATIYSPAHALAFATDPFFDEMRANMARKFGDDFLTLERGSLNQQCKIALSHIAGDDLDLRRRLISQLALYTMRNRDDDMDFSDLAQKPHILWGLADETIYSELKGPLMAIHQNPTGASGGERNHKAGKRVHSRKRSRMRSHVVESGTAILFNGRQIDRRLNLMRDNSVPAWIAGLGRQVQTTDAPTDPPVEDLDADEEAFAGDLSEFDPFPENSQLGDVFLFDEDEVIEEGISWQL